LHALLLPCWRAHVTAQMRPLTHDLMKNMLTDIGYRVTKVRAGGCRRPPPALPACMGCKRSTSMPHAVALGHAAHTLTSRGRNTRQKRTRARACAQVRVTDIIANTYYARIHIARGGDPPHEVDVDARPSDAINLAVRFGAPVYISKKIAGALVCARGWASGASKAAVRPHAGTQARCACGAPGADTPACLPAGWTACPAVAQRARSRCPWSS
jgi:hypothetical protein